MARRSRRDPVRLLGWVFVVAALVAWVVLDYSAQRRILGDLEERGVTRRSQRKAGGT